MLTLLQLREIRDVLDYLPVAPKWLASRDVPRAEVENAIHIVDQAIREVALSYLEPVRYQDIERARVMGETIASLRQPILPNHSPRLARENAFDDTENEVFRSPRSKRWQGTEGAGPGQLLGYTGPR